jgi:hypothetical protein
MKKFISITYVLFFSMLIAMPAIAVETEVYPSRAATETVAGEVELATDAETVTGTATDKVTTPANITAKMDAPGEIGGTTPAPATFTDLESISGLFTVGRDTDGSVGLFLERRYIGKYDWLIKNNSNLEIYGGDGNGTVPTDLRFSIDSATGIVGISAGLSVTGSTLTSTHFVSGDGYIFEDGQTGDTWFWMGQTSNDDAVDDDLWYMGKGNSIGTDSFMSIDGDGNLDSNGTASFAGMYMQSITGKRTASAVDYNPSALTTDYIIAITNTDAARSVVISSEDVESGSATQPRLFKIVDQSLGAAAHNITITLENGGTINGAASFVLNQNGQAQDLYVDGSDATLH